jgi:hypothetical protein
MNAELFLHIKEEYTEMLVDILSPYIYEGLNQLYKTSVDLAEKANDEKKDLLIFQKYLQSVDSWSQKVVEDETERIKRLSGTSAYLDDLVKSVVKSKILLLTYSNTISDVIGQAFFNTLSTPYFIHRCYIECAKDAHNNPYLFSHRTTTIDFKRNQMLIEKNIQCAIQRAINKILPITLITKEFLVNTVNIVPEPQKVELVGAPPVPAPAIPVFGGNALPQPTIPFGSKPLSEKKMDPTLEKQVMKIIKSDAQKSDHQKVNALMNLERMITSIEPSKIADLPIIFRLWLTLQVIITPILI